ncbi:hypothetical protein RhiirA4_484665 [Rhizophagus irregularis]|uniref:Uncharacterized protein n=1 Tax=Rhizophagus irregularis TaxID=588596 RepID=A0A2I1HP82_9GLOM|nr:hypothetical protein RhiirA4_484665 [Rhizophagus irregularis]
MNLVQKNGKIPSWFLNLIAIPNLISYLPSSSDVVPYPSYLMSLQGSALDIIDEHSRIKARNRYYWIAGLSGSDSMIFGRVFYTVDVHGTRIVYFSHWISSSSNRFTLFPCQGCFLHDASIVDGPLQVRSVGSKLTHKSCLTFLPSYRCLQLFHMPTRYSCVRVPELFLVNPGVPSNMPTIAKVSPQLPIVTPTLIPDIHLCSHLHIYLYAKMHNTDVSSSDSIGCGWIQPSELGFILQVLRLLPSNCSINFYSVHPYATLYENFAGSSPEQRVSADPYLSRCSVLVDSLSSNDRSLSFNSLLDSPPFRRLLIVSLCDGAPLIIDPIKYWRIFMDMREFFDILNLSRFIPLRSSYSSIDWNLTFDLFKKTLYHRVDVAQITSAHRFHLQLWFDELPLMSRLRFRYPGLYADDSLCPNCGIFMETLEHFFTCSPDEPLEDSLPPISFRNRLLELLDRFLNRLAQKASNSPKAQSDLDTLLSQLKSLPSLGFSSL